MYLTVTLGYTFEMEHKTFVGFGVTADDLRGFFISQFLYG